MRKKVACVCRRCGQPEAYGLICLREWAAVILVTAVWTAMAWIILEWF